MTDLNYDRVLKSHFDNNMTIEQSIFKKTVFHNTEVEEKYILESSQISKTNKKYFDAFVIFCYISIFIYILINKYQIIFAYICLCCLGICLLLIASSYIKKSLSYNNAINHIMIFLLSIFLNFKIIYVAMCFITEEDDQDSEIIRTLTYDFISKNILCLIALDKNILVIVALYLFNVFAVIVVEVKSGYTHPYYLDNLVGLIVTVFCMYVKVLIEANNRSTFAKKYLFEMYFNYSREFIRGLNGNYMNIIDPSSDHSPKMKFLKDDELVDRITSKPRKFDSSKKLLRIGETSKIQEINSILSINSSEFEDSKSQLPVDILSLFTLYDEDKVSGNTDTNEKKLTDKLKVLMSEPSTVNFRKAGIYKLQSSNFVKYFDVHFRKYSINKNNSINDLMIYDVTELIESREKIVQESIIKQKNMTKIVHSVKTPLNSMIALLGALEDSIKSENHYKNNPSLKHLDNVRNLCKYIIFVTSDIIHYTNVKSLEERRINLGLVNLREIANFGFDVLNSLLTCNKAKSEAVIPVLEFDEEIDSLEIKADDVRLKQIILNFVSNAVKFTKAGWIKLKCKFISEKQHVLFSIIDTGVGIDSKDKDSVFNDFKMIKNDISKNDEGSGLGLWICKSLASTMKMKTSFTSIIGEGSEFYLEIPTVPKTIELIELKSKDNSEMQKEVDLQEIDFGGKSKFDEISESDRLNTSHNHIVINELNFGSNEVRLYFIIIKNIINKSHMSRIDTVRLGCNDYIDPGINFLDFKLQNDQVKSRSPISPQDFLILPVNQSLELSLDVSLKSKKKGKILVVDDSHLVNEVTVRLLRKVLTEAGSDMEIIVASDGSEMVHNIIQDQYKGNEIKCIFTDENMEYLNGSEAIRIIRNLENRRKVKFVNIISVTSNEEPYFIDEIKKAGAQTVLGKPLTKFVLARVLKEFKII